MSSDFVTRQRLENLHFAKYTLPLVCGQEITTRLDSRVSPDLPRGMGKSIGGDLDIDDEGSEQCRFEPEQSLHHGSVGYQPVHTRIGLAKKAMSLQANREHKQEQERTISNE
jgi:hypothetical protein